MPPVSSDPLLNSLSQVFDFPAFRPGQEAVCRAVVAGQDALVVMPTGSGKSLCYQLPAVVLGGTALVISPLIALMEDQVAKLNGIGLRADRIHSGRKREDSRAAALAYRDDTVQFLFIAPERLSVAGFPEFLARRKPSLVAVDEAHCISQWGHDFRPDYRMLQRYLPTLRPAPIMALTATATPVVQNDIVQQLALTNAMRSIQGFRRDNIAIEVVEVSPSARRSLVARILRDDACRPAIVYVPTRAESDATADELSPAFRVAPYHAGLTAQHRQEVQESFLAGHLEVIVATIAFGMGIDKPDVRTVIHTALPGSTEAYYQEIGRAGRDGAPSRAILMHSYADRHRHDFFFDRDYPDPAILDRIFERLRDDRPVAKAELQRKLNLDDDLFDIAIDKLWVHRGALIDPEENLLRGNPDWRDSYVSQSERRSGQLALMLRYAASDQCRMASLVRYFGDRADTRSWCGLCDFCAPETSIAQHFRDATFAEERVARRVLSAISSGGPRATGRLHAELCADGELDRDEFEEVLAGLARAGFIVLREAVFEKDGKSIPYRTASLTRDGEIVEDNDALALTLREREPKPGRRKAARSKAARTQATTADPANGPLTEALRAWRLAEAKRQNVPAFRIATDQVFRGIAEDRPLTEEDLLAVPGVGPSFVKRLGADVLQIVKRFEA